MKNHLFLTGLFFVLSLSSFAQMKISTDLRMNFTWDAESEDWKYESEDAEEFTFLEFNKDFSMVKHTTPTVTSAYLIKSQEHYEEGDKNQYWFEVLSDAGNKYLMIFDITNNNVRFVSFDKSFMVRHRIKRVWQDED